MQNIIPLSIELARLVPLSIEILKQNGFNINDSYAEFSTYNGNDSTSFIQVTPKNNNSFDLFIKNWVTNSKLEMTIQFVNELQEALHLLKIDKDIII